MGNYSFAGTLGADPELKFKADGGEFCKFSVAENTMKKGDPKNKTIWWNCVTWDAELALVICKYRKGQVIQIESSKLEPSEYNGVKSFNVVVWKLKPKGAHDKSGLDREYEPPEDSGIKPDDVPF